MALAMETSLIRLPFEKCGPKSIVMMLTEYTFSPLVLASVRSFLASSEIPLGSTGSV